MSRKLPCDSDLCSFVITRLRPEHSPASSKQVHMLCKVKAKTKIRACANPQPESKKRNRDGDYELPDATSIVNPANLIQKRHPRHLISIEACHQKQTNFDRGRTRGAPPHGPLAAGRVPGGKRHPRAHTRSKHERQWRSAREMVAPRCKVPKKLKALVNFQGSWRDQNLLTTAAALPDTQPSAGPRQAGPK